MISFISCQPRNIIDFSIGEGELIKAAESKWPNASFSGTDINPHVVSLLNRVKPNWDVEFLDFMDEKSRKESITINKKKFDLILLNPPFSCKGSKTYSLEIEGKHFSVSKSMYFLMESINYMSKEGAIYSIMPANIPHSEKDRKAWNFLKNKYDLKILSSLGSKQFKGCSANVIITAINDRSSKNILLPEASLLHNTTIKRLKRGSLGMHEYKKLNKGRTPFIHTTNLKRNKIEGYVEEIENHISLTKGPCILIPRVGNPNRNKICLIQEGKYIISDCIISIEMDSQRDSILLFNKILSKWDLFSNLYNGTGARYITLKRLRLFLNIDENSTQKQEKVLSTSNDFNISYA